MRFVLCLILCAFVCLLAGSVSAATLADMGLAGAVVVDDTAAMQVRGLGYASAYGYSRAVYHNSAGYANANHGYTARSLRRNARVGGENQSFAGYNLNGLTAGGFSQAFAR